MHLKIHLNESATKLKRFLDKHDENVEIVNTKTRVHIMNKIGVPVVNLQQHHKRFLGMPFSKCIDKDPTKHPENDFYTRETCREFDYAQDDFLVY